MRVAIVAEGSYPFIRGGVASWIHMLISSKPDIQFEIISIMPNDFKAEYKYSLLENVQNVRVYQLGKVSELQSESQLSTQEMNSVSNWLSFKQTDEEALRILADYRRLGSVSTFLQSRPFWNIVQRTYQEEAQSSSFIDYFWMYRSMCESIVSLLQQDFPEVDLVHAVSTGYAGVVGAYIKEQQNIPFILTEHGIYTREREEEILRATWIPNVYKERWIQYFYHLSKQAYHSADQIITLFGRNSEYQKELGAPDDKLRIIPNGIDYDGLKHIKCEGVTNKLRIGAIVRLVPIKDIKTMLYAARMLADEGIDFELRIMGPMDEDWDYAQECLELKDRLMLQDYVIFTGQIHVKKHLPTLDLLWLTSISEGQPLAILEGLGAGIPFIATDVGSCFELLLAEDGFGQAGFIVPPVNPKVLADKSLWVYHNRDEARRFGENGRRRVEAKYQWRDVIKEYTTIYEMEVKRYRRHRI
jgi:glycosyltransferase involved in cell wall biosynthesis